MVCFTQGKQKGVKNHETLEEISKIQNLKKCVQKEEKRVPTVHPARHVGAFRGTKWVSPARGGRAVVAPL